MKWTLINNSSSTVQLFNLTDANNVKSVVRYNPAQRSARITCMQDQRLFFIEQPAYNSHQFIFKNEYGFSVGRLIAEEANSGDGTIEIEEKKFHYRQLVNSELVVYKDDHILPLTTCNFIKNPGLEQSRSQHNKKLTLQYASLLLGLCWYLSHSSFSEANAGYRPSLSLT